MSNFKVKRIDSKEHREFVIQNPCIVTGYLGEYLVPHHLLRVESVKGTGTKSCDMWCVPLHSTIHDMLHKNGNERVFFINNGRSYEWVIGHACALALRSPDVRIVNKMKQWECDNG